MNIVLFIGFTIYVLYVNAGIIQNSRSLGYKSPNIDFRIINVWPLLILEKPYFPKRTIRRFIHQGLLCPIFIVLNHFFVVFLHLYISKGL